jgi:hypothetical protein
MLGKEVDLSHWEQLKAHDEASFLMDETNLFSAFGLLASCHLCFRMFNH